MQDVISRLKQLKNREEVLREVYNILTGKYKGERLGTFLKFPLLFIGDVNRLWARTGFLHCTAMNYLLRILLVKSGFFTEKDIELKITFIYCISVHQYAKVKISEE